jgi:hypothetical protein
MVARRTTSARAAPPPQGALGRSMPALGGQISDAEMVALLRFVRARFSTQPSWQNLENAVRSIRSGH